MNHSHHHSELIRHKQNSTMKAAALYSVRQRFMEIMCTEHHKIFRLWLIYSGLHGGTKHKRPFIISRGMCVYGAKMKTESRGRKCINFHEAHSYKPSIKNGISNADIHVFCASLYSPYLPYFIANTKINHVLGIFQALYAKIFKIGDWKCETAGAPSWIEF